MDGERSWGCVSAVDSNRRTIFVADAHRDDGKRFVVRADEKLTAFLELESAIRARPAVGCSAWLDLIVRRCASRASEITPAAYNTKPAVSMKC